MALPTNKLRLLWEGGAYMFCRGRRKLRLSVANSAAEFA